MNQTELLQAAADLAAHIKQQHPQATADDIAAMLTLALLTTHDAADAAMLFRNDRLAFRAR